MAGRIRSIKPELRELLAFAQLSDGAARLFLMLYTLVDDHGRCPASASFLAGAVFFARRTSAQAIGRLIAELDAAKLISPYEVNRAPYVEVLGWHDKASPTHQRIDKPQPSRYPAPPWFRSETGSATSSGTDSKTDLRPPTSDLDRVAGPGEEREGTGTGTATGSARTEPVPEDHRSPAALPTPGLTPGGAAEKEARKRIAAGELEHSDVHRCVAKFGEQTSRQSFNGDKHRDAALAKWIRNERAEGAAADAPVRGRYEPELETGAEELPAWCRRVGDRA